MSRKLRWLLYFAILQGVTESDTKQEGTPTTPPSAPLLGQEGRKILPVNFNAWQLAWELGYAIAIPIVVLALVGRWADRAWGTSPWLLLAGIVVSVFISSFMVYRRVKKIL
jgi:hypothetical protein